jgi:c-di-GMP-related signal transduction protein
MSEPLTHAGVRQELEDAMVNAADALRTMLSLVALYETLRDPTISTLIDRCQILTDRLFQAVVHAANSHGMPDTTCLDTEERSPHA